MIETVLEELKTYGWVFTGLATCIAAIWAVFTFQQKVKNDYREAALKRFEKFQAMRLEYRSDESIKNSRREAIGSNIKAADDEKYRFMAFVEQIALMVQSELMSVDVAFYVFGYEIVAAYQRETFWSDDLRGARESGYWKLYRVFSQRMIDYGKKYPQDNFPVHTFRF